MQDAIILYENGKAIGGEGHPTDADDITFDNAGTDIVANKVGSAIKEVNAKTSGLTRMTKLWENPSPTASFSAQDITFASDDYDFYIFQVKGNKADSGTTSLILARSQYMNLLLTVTQASGGALTMSRAITDGTGTLSIAIASYSIGTGARQTSTDYCIPITIYGIKII